MPASAPPGPPCLCTGDSGPWGDSARYLAGGDKIGVIPACGSILACPGLCESPAYGIFAAAGGEFAGPGLLDAGLKPVTQQGKFRRRGFQKPQAGPHGFRGILEASRCHQPVNQPGLGFGQDDIACGHEALLCQGGNMCQCGTRRQQAADPCLVRPRQMRQFRDVAPRPLATLSNPD